MELAPLIHRIRSSTRPTLEVVPDPGDVHAIAMLAGSFDPPTVAHEALAKEAVRRTGMVILVYSVRTLPKEGAGPPPLLSEDRKLRVLERFCAARRGHALGLVSHGLLAEQIEAAAEQFPDVELALVMGSDKALQLLDPKWYADRDAALRELFARARVLYAERSGQEGAVRETLARSENRSWRGQIERLDVPPEVAAVSSRRVREMVGRGEDVRTLVPAEAWAALRVSEG